MTTMNKTLADRLHELCVEIEKLPASEQQTKVSLLAGDILESVGRLTPRADLEEEEVDWQDDHCGWDGEDAMTTSNPLNEDELNAIDAYFQRVCARAEATIERTHQVSGAHYAAMQVELNLLRQNGPEHE